MRVLIVRVHKHALMHAAPQVAESRRKTFAKALTILDSQYLHDRPFLAGAHLLPRRTLFCALPAVLVPCVHTHSHNLCCVA